MTETETQAKITERFGDKAAVTIARARRVWITVSRDNLTALAQWLKTELGYYHVSTVTGLDSGDNLEALYHISDGNLLITLRVAAPKSAPHLPTLTGVLPGITLYERELQDMFGFVIDGHPDPRRYVLPEDWPQDVYPLRKEFKPEGMANVK